MSVPRVFAATGLVLSLLQACGGDGTPANGGTKETGGAASGTAGAAVGGASGTSAGGALPQSGSAGIGGVAQGGTSGGLGGAISGAGGVPAGAGGIGAGAGGASGAGAGGRGAAGGASGAAGRAGSSGTAGTGGTGGTDPTLPPGLATRFPRGDATGVCPDVALRLTFASSVTLGSSGRIQVFAQSAPGTAIDTIDMGAANTTDSIGGKSYNLVRPVFIDGNQAVAYFHHRRLAANTAYYVTVDSGVFNASGFRGITGTTAWRFTTGPTPAASASLSVAATGGGSFCSVQGAIDAVPANNTNAVTVTVGAATYHEIVYVTNKRNVTLRGADRATTTIAYPNNENLNGGTSGRPMMFLDGANGFVLENMTLHNTTPQGGSQAEALRSDGDQVIIRNSTLRSFQDTLLSAGRLYVSDSTIEGNVDFIWGDGVAYFDHCEIKTIDSSGVGVQARNGTGYGYVFVDSRLTSDAGITGHALARIDVSAYPNSHVAFIDCQLGTHISAAGWTIAGGGSTSNLRFWEYQSTTLTGGALNVSGRAAGSRQISASEAAMMRDKATVLGGWNPN